MKKNLLATTLLLYLFTLALNAQISTENTAKAKAYIEQGKGFAMKEEYAQAAQYFQKAYDISASMLDCESIQFLGVSYYMMENNPSAIKFLELSVECVKNREELARLHIYLSDSYLDMGDYNKAVANSLKGIANTADDKSKSVLYEELANIHYDHKQPDLTLGTMQKSIDHYLKHLSTSRDDVMRGGVINEELGKLYFNLSWFASDLKRSSVMMDSIIKSALSGNKDAIGFCKENNIDYKDAIAIGNSSDEATREAQEHIKQAGEFAIKKEYKSVISHLQKAHAINPTLFTGSNYHLMGLSYYMLSNFKSAIQYMERALQFDFDKTGLYFIYATLGDAYYKEKNYTKALKNAEKALYLANSNEDVFKCSLKLANIYYAQENFDSTIESYQHAIKYYMLIHSISESEVMKGNVKDKFLAETHLKLTSLLSEQMRGKESDLHLMKAALCGSELATEVLENQDKK